ncbi:MAG: Holliday junction branch migration DNA helicase RuvB [Spirochaetia bacterium]|jgi:holliday junction DNA helicase RuvB|nr:Holliday junction branch migration DNA helicase RuvB [Spirochaetia bacterium]MCF7940451.1 Holliday junction branch migration DNA helicase RuvB [Spirochaetia bacterium]
MEERIVTNQEHTLDQKLQDDLIRPKFLKDFQGQQELKDNLKIFITASKDREQTLDHVFISGPPGLGKTTLASIIANEMDAEIKMTSAPALEKPKDLAGILTTIKEGSIFFIDEIHRLRPVLEEMLYIAMEDFEIDWVIGQGPAARTIRVPIPQFTMIGATTKAGKVAAPLYTRFGITSRIGFYQEEELQHIISRSARIIGASISDEAVVTLSRCSRGTPRIANRLLRRLRDYAEVLGDGIITPAIVTDGLERLGIDHHGLDALDIRILETIIDFYHGGPVGAETLAISVGEAIESLEDFYEPYLIQKGYLKRTPRGRMVTEKAYELLHRSNKEPHEDQRLLF